MKKRVVLLLVLILFLLSISQVVFAQDDIEVPGQIAFIGSDYNVYTINPQNESPTALSDDAELGQTAATIYEWPMWSTDGQLAYVNSTLNSDGGITTNILISADGRTPGEVVYTGAQEHFTYASWSPQACGENCSNLALLLNDPTGLLVKLVHIEDGTATNSLAGVGAPFYSSWSPDGTQMLWQRNNAQFEIYDVIDGSISETLEHLPGRMFTPEWSPVDDRLLLGIRNENTTDLVITDADALTILAAELTNPVWFAWSPDGSSVAYIDREGPVIVLDAMTGDEITRTPIGGVLAFFWSPDSQHIAYISLGTPPGSFSAYNPSGDKSLVMKQQEEEPSGLAWSVFDVADGANRRYAPFQPTNQFVYLLQYFDQFATSHHVWSPDSRYLVFGEILSDSRPIVSLLDAMLDSAVSTELAEGLVGIWSFE
jgi:TolB protein